MVNDAFLKDMTIAKKWVDAWVGSAGPDMLLDAVSDTGGILALHSGSILTTGEYADDSTFWVQVADYMSKTADRQARYASADQIAEAIELSKTEILIDVANGEQPVDLKDFRDLHDHADANEYGGLTNGAETGIEWTRYTVGPEGPLADNDPTIAVQDAVDEWIKAGGARVHSVIDAEGQSVTAVREGDVVNLTIVLPGETRISRASLTIEDWRHLVKSVGL
jgi:hypothetical protein